MNKVLYNLRKVRYKIRLRICLLPSFIENSYYTLHSTHTVWKYPSRAIKNSFASYIQDRLFLFILDFNNKALVLYKLYFYPSNICCIIDIATQLVDNTDNDVDDGEAPTQAVTAYHSGQHKTFSCWQCSPGGERYCTVNLNYTGNQSFHHVHLLFGLKALSLFIQSWLILARYKFHFIRVHDNLV